MAAAGLVHHLRREVETVCVRSCLGQERGDVAWAGADLDHRRTGSAWEENDLVFCQPNGRPLDPDGHSKAWKKFLAMAGVREGRLHDARHTAATLLLVQGVDQRTVMAIMGWSEVAMTKRYQHVVPELRREAAARMGEVLWGPTTARRDAPDGQ